MIEIERKFLVKDLTFISDAGGKHHIAQGYLNSNPDRTVRIRIMGESGFLTVKGRGNESGMTRFEWETELSLQEARPMLAMCEPGWIEKTRYLVPSGKHVFEVDVFLADNEGLIIAEIELSSEDEEFIRPDWLGAEVTSDARYYNAYLSQNPYKDW